MLVIKCLLFLYTFNVGTVSAGAVHNKDTINLLSYSEEQTPQGFQRKVKETESNIPEVQLQAVKQLVSRL
jgi:hypothetical protein